MTSYTQPNFDQIWWKKYLGQFLSELFDSLQWDSTKCAAQYKLNDFVTMATYYFRTSPILKTFLVTFGISYWCDFYAWSSKHKNVSSSLWLCLPCLSITCELKGWATNAFFAAINQMFGRSSQLLTTAQHCFVVWTLHDLITARSAVVRSWEEPPSTWLTVELWIIESACYWKEE